MSDVIYLAHHGVKGQKHGVRQWQNPDGSLTPAGRIHYGVGAARKTIGKVGSAIRKKVAPTNDELDEKIRKQKERNLNSQKRRELRDLKRGINVDASSSSSKAPKGQHKRFSEMSDEDIQSRIKRLKSEIELADLERTKSMGPGMRMVDKIVRDAGSRALTNILSDAVTAAGKKAIVEAIQSTKQGKAEERKKEFESELGEKQAKKALSDWKKENPEGLSKLNPVARREAKKRKESTANERAFEKAQKSAKGRSELERRAKAYQNSDFTIKEIASRLNVSVGEVKDLLYSK